MNENGNYDSNLMPLSSEPNLRKAQEKILNNEPLTLSEKIILGRDHPIQIIDGYKLKSDCAYRAISEKLYEKYLELGFIYGTDKDDEYIEFIQDGKIYNNNRGVDWYLGGVCLRYGEVIIECPASSKYFKPAYDNGCHLSANPNVRHIKSSGFNNPVPISMIKLIKHPNINELEINSKSR